MIAANLPVQRPSNAKVLIVDRRGHVKHQARSEFINLLRLGDVVVANDAATLPASLFGQHSRTGRQIEVRLAGRDSLNEVGRFSAVVFGEGDFRTRTENRSNPPALIPGDRLELGRLRATVARLLNHPRLISLPFEGSPQEIWEGLPGTGDLSNMHTFRPHLPFGTLGHQ
jgi:S-adenosylmethionine:tRNA ribosyltransferase-isomerase